MKKIKIIIISLITILLVVYGGYKIVEAKNTNSNIYDIYYKNNMPVGKEKLTQNDLYKYDNVYCVAYFKENNFPTELCWDSWVEIDGNTAKFCDGQVVESQMNNILAAILCPEALGGGGLYGYQRTSNM